MEVWMDGNRRKFLQIVAGGIVSGGVLGMLPRARIKLPRPPGALVEPEFLARCQRCMRCIDACQPTALSLAHPGAGFAAIGTPVLDYSKCILCMECIRICPSGALAKVAKEELHMGLAVIEQSKCLAYLKKRRCQDCFKACRELKAITMEKKRFPVIDPDKCNGCGACVRRCPEMEKGAIVVDVSYAKRFEPQPERFIARLESRTEVVAPPSLFEWFQKRLITLAQTYGLK